MINPQIIYQLMQNPMGALLSRGFNIPQNVQLNSPKDIVMYLVNSGQVNQETLNQAQNTATQMGYKV